MFPNMLMKMRIKKLRMDLRIKILIIKILVIKLERFQEKEPINKIKDLMERNILKIKKIQEQEDQNQLNLKKQDLRQRKMIKILFQVYNLKNNKFQSEIEFKELYN